MPELTTRQLVAKLGGSRQNINDLARRHGWEYTTEARGRRRYRVPDDWLEDRMEKLRAKMSGTLETDLLEQVHRMRLELVTLRKMVQQLLDRDRP